MRRTLLRVGSVGALAALAGGLISWGGGELRGQVKAVQPLPPGATPPAAKSSGSESLAFNFPEDRESKQRLQAARDYLDRKDIPWDTVCSIVQKILDAQSDSFFEIKDASGTETTARRVSVKSEANGIIAAFPKEGLEFYQITYGPTADGLLKEAVLNNYDRDTLANISQRFFHTKAGAEATVLLGTIYLDRGLYLDAADCFERLLRRPGGEGAMSARTLYKAALALQRSGEPRQRDTARRLWELVERQVPRNGLAIGRRTFDADGLRKELDRKVETNTFVSLAGDWAMRYGNAARNATAEGGAPFLDPVFTVPMLYQSEGDLQTGTEWVRQNLGLALKSLDDKAKPPALPGFFPLTAPNMVVYRAYDGVYAVATRDHLMAGRPVRAGDVCWVTPTHYGLVSLFNDTDRTQPLQWWSGYQASNPGLLFENPLLGTMTHDGRNVYFVDDLAVPPPPVLYDPNMGMVQPVNAGVLVGRWAGVIKASRLTAVNLQTGKEVWALGAAPPTDAFASQPDPKEAGEKKAPPAPLPPLTDDEEETTTSAYRLFRDAHVLGAPLPLNGRLYVLIERQNRVRLACLDPRNIVPAGPGMVEKVPTLVWSQRLGSPTSAVSADAVRRVQGAQLAAAEGIVVCPTNSGAVVAVDVMSRSLLWAYTYRYVSATDPSASGFPQGVRIRGGYQPQLPKIPDERWRASAPIIVNGRVVFTAYDADKLVCLDLRSGKELWKVGRKAADLYVGGVVDDKVVVVGKDEIRAYHLTELDPAAKGPPAPKLAWSQPLDRPPSGHGVPTKAVYFLPVKADPTAKDAAPEIWAVDIGTGRVGGKISSRQSRRPADGDEAARAAAQYGIGNLVFHDGQVIAQSPWQVAAFPELELKKAEMNRLLAANPNDPKGLIDRGELLLDDGKLAAAIADFKAAQKNNPPEEVARRLREKLYVAFTELLRNDFPAAEQYLDEYKGLCEIPLEGEDPSQRQRLADESARRKGDYLCLVAQGRKKQGRLVEAFDHYMAFAGMEDGKELKPVPGQPGVRMRPDVYARSQIKLMIDEATDPAARKPLEDRVRKEWEAVRGADDLARLRDFVAVFAPYFATGAEAQFRLADKLLAADTEADGREAQAHLSELRATADDPGVRAKATEALARLMIRRGLLEDAVGLYLQLGKDFPKVVVRDGKTGADFLNDLLTDKRLLPYLEPSRMPWPGRVKAEESRDAGFNGQFSFAVEPDGELLPFFRRFRLVMEQQQDANAAISYTLRVQDRLTGEEWWKYPGLMQDRTTSWQGGHPNFRFVQASGHLLLVHLGSMVYCLDLAQKRRLWEDNLLGRAHNPQQHGQITQEIGPDGDVIFRYPEGYAITIGRAAVLQPRYVALLARGELVARDPATGKQLWVRGNVPASTRLFGDGKYLLAVEYGGDRKPTTARLLRAADGGPVERAADPARAMAAAASFAAFGRHVLLTEAPADGPRVARLFDTVTGKDVWRKEFDKKAVPLKTGTREWVGFIQPTGEMSVLDALTGAVVGTGTFDEKYRDAHLKNCPEAQLLHDKDRFYVILGRDPAAPAPAGGPVAGRRAFMSGWVGLRTQKVDGPMYCFDRATGKRLWFNARAFEDQLLVLEQFDELPVIVAASQKAQPNGQLAYDVVVVEKERGMLRFHKSLPGNYGVFGAIRTDPKAGTIDFLRTDLRLRVSADDDRTVARP